MNIIMRIYYRVFGSKRAQRNLCNPAVKKESVVMLNVNHIGNGNFCTVFPD